MANETAKSALDSSAILESAPSVFTAMEGFRVHHKTFGKGSNVVVMIHGWSSDLTFWNDQIHSFSRNTRVILIDLPGHGGSDQPAVEYSMDFFARSVDAVLTSLRAEKAVLVGHSMGAAVARQYYRKVPTKVKAIVVLDGELRRFSEDQKAIDDYLSQFNIANLKEKSMGLTRQLFSPNATADVRARVIAGIDRTSPQVALSSLRNLYDPPIWKEDEIGVPLLAIMTDGPLWSQDYREFVRKLVPKLQYHTIKGVGHFLHMETPDQVNLIIINFLKELGVWETH